ncbi:MAG: DUF2520 domain-containing protein [Microthrixaceae bacterium]|nr:DUF2520 domain-containing protein [Microthrixaceae bacterium]MCO5311405.1 DUF2520 domain-containing protein [Microthrixaceae bacterium]HPB44331.1 DUF2520 domain-containing protein [Microthrixaceae bacterium]
MTTKVRIVGAGRAGGAFALALRRAGWNVDGPIGRDHAAIEAAADGVDLVLVCVSDPAIAEVASTIRPGDAVVAHVAGAVGLDVLAPHRRVGAIHPLVSLPSAELGAERLVGAWYGTGGDPIVWEVARALRGRSFRISDLDRVTYHAAACVAANHLVALLGQVERLAASIGAPIDAYLDMAAAVVENVRTLGAAEALTGPAARGDLATIERHLEAIGPDERDTYRVLAREATRLAGRDLLAPLDRIEG